MADYYSADLPKGIEPSYRHRVKPTGQTVLGKIGGSAPSGYTQTGTRKVYSKAAKDYVDLAIYSKQEAASDTTSKTDTDTATDSGTATEPKTVTSNVPAYQPQTFDTSAFDTAISTLNTRIADLTTGFQTQLGTLTTQMQQEREAASKRMEEMQGNFAQALAQRETRPRVEGIRTPDRGTGGASQQQLQRRGVRGSFGRAGDRLMKISALNV